MGATVAIVGAGPVGLALAIQLRLYRPDLALTLFERKAAVRLGQDQRTLVLSEASRQMLTRMQAWPAQTQPITHIHVSHTRKQVLGDTLEAFDAINHTQPASLSSLPRLLLEAEREGLPAFGYAMPYPMIWRTLAERATQLGATIQTGVVAEQPALAPDGRAQLRLAHAEPKVHQSHQTQPAEAATQASFDLVVMAEGGLFHEQPKRSIHHDSAQTAIICPARVQTPVPHMAFERFTPQGPLALIPSALAEWHVTVVHCVPTRYVQAVLAWPESERVARLNALLPIEASRLTNTGAAFALPLGLNAHGCVLAHSQDGFVGKAMPVVMIGNAAQTMHPVAGQGLNVGLRDACQLTDALRDWRPAPADTGVAPPTRSLLDCLKGYQRARQTDRLGMMLATELLAMGFIGDAKPLRALRGAGLALMQTAWPLRRKLVDVMLYGWA